MTRTDAVSRRSRSGPSLRTNFTRLVWFFRRYHKGNAAPSVEDIERAYGVLYDDLIAPVFAGPIPIPAPGLSLHTTMIGRVRVTTDHNGPGWRAVVALPKFTSLSGTAVEGSFSTAVVGAVSDLCRQLGDQKVDLLMKESGNTRAEVVERLRLVRSEAVNGLNQGG